MKNDDNKAQKIEIILPTVVTPPIRRSTTFMLGVSSALMFAAFINFNESLGLLATGIIAFLFITDEGFRRIF